MELENINLCIDMAGCPNLCRHCYIGHFKCNKINKEDLLYIYNEFKKISEKINLFHYVKEPDYVDNYQKIDELCNKLSYKVTPHFELISHYLAYRDDEYVKWLKFKNLNYVQLTFFGDEEFTNYYYQRKNVYNELLVVMNKLLDNNIGLRIQIFVYKKNIHSLNTLLNDFQKHDFESKSKYINKEFKLFVHQGSPMGAGINLANDFITKDDIKYIPSYLLEKTYEHFNSRNIKDIFGEPEKDLIEFYQANLPSINFFEKNPYLFVDSSFNVYTNISHMNKDYYLGNIKTNGVKEILDNYVLGNFVACKTFKQTQFIEMLESVSDKKNLSLFGKRDYVFYILDKYLSKI